MHAPYTCVSSRHSQKLELDGLQQKQIVNWCSRVENQLYSSRTCIFSGIFTESAPLGRFSHRVAMSVVLCVVLCLVLCVVLCVVLRHRVQLFEGHIISSRPPIAVWVKVAQVYFSEMGSGLKIKPPPSLLCHTD